MNSLVGVEACEMVPNRSLLLVRSLVKAYGREGFRPLFTVSDPK